MFALVGPSDSPKNAPFSASRITDSAPLRSPEDRPFAAAADSSKRRSPGRSRTASEGPDAHVYCRQAVADSLDKLRGDSGPAGFDPAAAQAAAFRDRQDAPTAHL